MAPPSLSTMSMSIRTEASSGNFTNGAGLRQTDEPSDFQKKSSSLPVSDLSSETEALAEVQPRSQIQQAGTDSKSDGSPKKLITYEEIARRKQEGEALIVVDGHVYDVGEFLPTHPGGVELILEHLKSEQVPDAGPLMRGTLDEDGHSHSKAAFLMLEQFFVGSVQAPPGAVQTEAREAKKYRYTVDLTKPIVPQVGYLGSDYDQWVHDPIISKESPRFFESDFHEFFTKTKWWVIPLVWVPLAMAMYYKALVVEKIPLSKMPEHFVFGTLCWTFIEYLLHRFLFHMKTSSYWGNTAHYVLHGFHHKHPMDGARLVFPPTFTLVFVIMIWILLGNWLVPYPGKLSVFASGLLAYVIYDLMHYFLHFGTAFNDRSRKMKRYHLNHHFKDQTNGFGITTTMWDWLFRSQPHSKLSVD